MDRRRFLKSSGAVLPVLLLTNEKAVAKARDTAAPTSPDAGGSAAHGLLFPKDLKRREWLQFRAEGFSEPACGVVYGRNDEVPHGMPLGGVATGCMDIDTNGTFGFFNLFNSGVPTRGPIGHEFLGIASGERCWVLTTREITGVENAGDIHYWGHFPVADLEYDLDAPFSVALRAWAPFVPGDTKVSNTPAAVFEVRLRNNVDEAHDVTLAFSFPGPTQAEAQISPTSPRELRYIGWPTSEPVAQGVITSKRERVTRGSFNGQVVSSPTGTAYAIGIIGERPARVGSALSVSGYDYVTGQQWVSVKHQLPKAAPGDFSSSLTADITLRPREEKTVRFLVAWYSPIWKGDKENYYARMYTREHKDAAAVAQFVADNHEELLRRTLAWQQAVYTADDYPVWLREALVNILHLTTKTGYWAIAQKPIGDWCRAEDGLFGMSECPRECPQIECIPCSFYGNVPMVYFFPDLALSTLRGYKAYQYPNGAPPWVFGGCTAGAAEGYEATDPCDMATPSPGYQNTLNGPCYVDMFDRLWQRTGDDELLKEFYPSIKKAVEYTVSLRSGPEGLISVPAGDRNPTQPHAKPGGGLDWFEGNGWFGMTPHVGGIHLAMIAMAARMAERAHDSAFAKQCRSWVQEGVELMDKHLWAGDYYIAYSEPEANKKSDLVFGYQLDGDWMAVYHGLPPVFPKERAQRALSKIRDTCVAINRYGAANFARPTASAADPKDFSAGGNWGMAGYGAHGYFPPEVYMLGATYMYAGDSETGTRIVRSCLEGISVKYGYTWTQPNVVSGDTGKRIYGSDYYQNMILWSVPAALKGQDLASSVKKGGLIDRVIAAGKKA